MGNPRKTLLKVVGGWSDANIAFPDLVALLRRLGFDLRIRGSHHIFTKEHVDEIINLQPLGSKAKAYQVRQVREIIRKHRLEDL